MTWLKSFFRKPPPQWPAIQRDRLLYRVRAAIRRGSFKEASNLLSDTGDPALHDAACLNLMGIVYEWEKKWKLARRCYGRAMRADRRFAAAEQNLRRLFELDTFGCTKLTIALGEKDCRLILLAIADDSLLDADPAMGAAAANSIAVTASTSLLLR